MVATMLNTDVILCLQKIKSNHQVVKQMRLMVCMNN